MRRFFKAQAVADLGHVPVGVAEEGFGFAGEAFHNMVGGGFAGGLADGPVKVIYVYR